MRRDGGGSLRRAGRAAALLAALVAAGGAGRAGAASLSGVTLTDASAVTSAGLEGPDYAVASALAETTPCGGGCSAFATRFRGAAMAEADEGFERGGVDFDWSYRIAFDVDAAPDEVWELAVEVRLLGALTLVDDSGGRAGAELGTFSGSYTGPGSAAGGLDVAGLGALSSAGGGDAGVDAGERRASLAVTGGVGPATLRFDFAAPGRVESSCGSLLACFFGGTRGDEAAVRLGEAGAPPADLDGGSFTAGAYPGPGGRALADDGHHVAFSLAAVPEPEASLLLGLGLLGLAIEGRRRPA